jgi:hypothetical protein
MAFVVPARVVLVAIPCSRLRYARRAEALDLAKVMQIVRFSISVFLMMGVAHLHHSRRISVDEFDSKES